MKICQHSPTLRRDKDIRSPLESWLAARYSYDSSTVICHELAVPRPSARIDIAVVNGVLAGFEIKSDLDTLLRLPRQVASFNHVFERATLVTTAAHSKKAMGILPDWWGVLVVDDQFKFRHIKRGRINRGVSIKHALYLLNMIELRALSVRNQCAFDRHLRKADAIEIIARNVKHSAVMHEVREALKNRANLVGYQTRLTAAADI